MEHKDCYLYKKIEDCDDNEVFKWILTVWGWDDQFNMLTEESGEYISALNKYRRKRIEMPELMEEIVDVFIMASQLRFVHPEMFDKTYQEKMKRIRERLKNDADKVRLEIISSKEKNKNE